jgi:hypothetical protein
VFCREGAAFTDPAALLAGARQALPDLPTEVLSLQPQGARFMDECGVWNVGRANPAVHTPTSSDVPALLITGTFDAVTPPSQAAEAAKTLRHGKVVRFPGLGHDVFIASDCGRRISHQLPESTGQLRHPLRRHHATTDLRELTATARRRDDSVREGGRCWQEYRMHGIRTVHQ